MDKTEVEMKYEVVELQEEVGELNIYVGSKW